ncbi:unknown [Firmicutes bacterium CAG:308]|nr:unknown [Firmicutes bacterium CAG:308]
MMICALTGSRRLELIISKEEGKKDQILQFIQEMLEKGYTDEMILGIKSVTKQLLKQAKLSH